LCAKIVSIGRSKLASHTVWPSFRCRHRMFSFPTNDAGLKCFACSCCVQHAREGSIGLPNALQVMLFEVSFLRCSKLVIEWCLKGCCWLRVTMCLCRRSSKIATCHRFSIERNIHVQTEEHRAWQGFRISLLDVLSYTVLRCSFCLFSGFLDFVLRGRVFLFHLR
jgi:hypothetical protein